MPSLRNAFANEMWTSLLVFFSLSSALLFVLSVLASFVGCFFFIRSYCLNNACNLFLVFVGALIFFSSLLFRIVIENEEYAERIEVNSRCAFCIFFIYHSTRPYTWFDVRMCGFKLKQSNRIFIVGYKSRFRLAYEIFIAPIAMARMLYWLMHRFKENSCVWCRAIHSFGRCRQTRNQILQKTSHEMLEMFMLWKIFEPIKIFCKLFSYLMHNFMVHQIYFEWKRSIEWIS